MTREEAIDLLDNLIGMVEDNQENDYDEALKMAIEALNVPDTNVGDTISRWAAIDAIDKYIGTFDAIDRNYLDGLRKAKSLLYNLPSAQRKGKWIMHIDDLFPAESTMECSECHHEQSLIIDDNFCPYCGAMTEGGES